MNKFVLTYSKRSLHNCEIKCKNPRIENHDTHSTTCVLKINGNGSREETDKRILLSINISHQKHRHQNTDVWTYDVFCLFSVQKLYGTYFEYIEKEEDKHHRKLWTFKWNFIWFFTGILANLFCFFFGYHFHFLLFSCRQFVFFFPCAQ